MTVVQKIILFQFPFILHFYSVCNLCKSFKWTCEKFDYHYWMYRLIHTCTDIFTFIPAGASNFFLLPVNIFSLLSFKHHQCVDWNQIHGMPLLPPPYWISLIATGQLKIKLYCNCIIVLVKVGKFPVCSA